MPLHYTCNSDALDEPRSAETLGGLPPLWLPIVTVAEAVRPSERARTWEQVMDMRAEAAHPTMLAQVAERFLNRTEAIESAVRAVSRQAGAWRRTAGQWLVQLTTQLTRCERAGIALLSTGQSEFTSLAHTGLPRAAGRRWWMRIQRALSDALWEQGGLPGLRAGQVVLVGRDSQAHKDATSIGPMLVAPLQLHGQLLGVLALEDHDEKFISAHATEVLARAMARLVILTLQDAASHLSMPSHNGADNSGGKIGRQDAVLRHTAHELKAPLTALKAHIQLGEKRLESLVNTEAVSDAIAQGVWEVRALLGRAEEFVAHEHRLASDLGDLAYLETGKLEIQPLATDLALIVRDAVEGQRLAWPSRMIVLDAPPAGVPVQADPDRILQVVTNYLMNALKYSRDDQPVEVRVRAEGNSGRVAVRDHGAGVPPEERKRIWERFYRSDSVKVLSGPTASLGLGLYISRSIVQRHHGKVGVKSALGQGSTFWFTLPLLATASGKQVSD